MNSVLLLRSICASLLVTWTIVVPLLTFISFTDCQLIATDGSKLPLRPISGGDRSKKCKLNCTRKRKRPVCGSDGRTYTSKCQIRKANCEGHHVTVEYRGKCPEATRCRAERSYAQRLARTPMVGIFIPECNSDGSYAEVQCHASTGYCWCVNHIGKPISGSSVQYKKPNCAELEKPTNKRRSSRGRKQKRDCSSTDRPQFTRNLIQIFRLEYLRMPATFTGKRVRTDASLDTIEKRVIAWKFTELDKNKDGKLSRRELKNLRRMVKKIVKPKACAKTFTKYCDLDQNRKITRKEWSVCLWIDAKILLGLFLSLNSDEQNNTSVEHPRIVPAPGPPRKDSGIWTEDTSKTNSSSPKSKPDILTSISRGSSTSAKETRGCSTMHESAVKDQEKNPGGEIYVPECTTDGKYEKAQCHKSTGYCWCVNQETGKPVPGTSVRNKKPDCENAVHQSRIIKGCPDRRKRKFLNDLLIILKQEMENSSNYSITPPSKIQQSEQEQMIRWKFTQIDTNFNRLLDRKEWKPFRRALKSQRYLRKCGRNFLRFCDANLDRKITIQEWLDCFNANEGSSGGPQAPNVRKGPNPFHKYLKSD